jgi:ribosomal protein S18 acetylase RimI-like enzyme
VNTNVKIIITDYSNPQHSEDLVLLLNQYAASPTGGGVELSIHTQENLVKELGKLPYAFSLLAYVDSAPAGLVNCFILFSTFQCKPVINIHDLFVAEEYRRQGISQLLLQKVEKMAIDRGACKITLEVLEQNHSAKNSYSKFGFVGYELDPKYGKAIFLEKSLPTL